MEEARRSTAGQGLGVAGFVIGLIALILSFIPCLGMWALIPGVIALVFSAVAFSQANRANAARGLIISALVLSILATSIAAWQFVVIRKATTGIGNEFRDEDLGGEIRENIRRALEGLPTDEDLPDDSVRFENEEMIKELERLEQEETDTVPEEETDTILREETDTIPEEQ